MVTASFPSEIAQCNLEEPLRKKCALAALKKCAILAVRLWALEPETRQNIWRGGSLQLTAAMMTRTWIIQRYKRVKFTIFSAVYQHFCSSSAAAASRHRGNNLGTTIKYLRKTTSGAAGIGLGAPG
jgi:hypothetical protein